MRKACQGRPVSEDDLALLAQEVEESIRAKGLAEIDANDVGLEILKPLQRLDTVAYLRFASVYQAFEGLDDFESAIRSLRAEAGSAPADTAPEDTSREDSAPEDSAPAAGTRGSERGEEDGPQQQTLI